MDVDQILRHAIEKETEAARLYGRTAERTEDESLAPLLRELKGDEEGHRQELEALRERGAADFRPEAALDLDLAQYMEAKPLSPDATLREALQYAMRREHDAWEVYRTMADACRDAEARELFQRLAVMENSHKARLEEEFYRLFLAGA
jgi:rubrerythrin